MLYGSTSAGASVVDAAVERASVDDDGEGLVDGVILFE
jgi:hypothetical protein